ncbi:dihydrolipoamide acetyltransferase family protein [Actinotalea solisilvae]|uniref:dihydrolipoamide acetyltransferase family protein n=1 Tax=Actinotalea solisilvae TaxID=2072922 RepID=UPI0018F1FC19|nr:dihydrolipoamide acetyltransferase family protein [Actinotalea solisilvae]
MTVTEREFAMPDLGEGLTEADLVTWEVAVGDTVTLNQVIAEVETAKALVQLPSPFAGVVTRLCVEEGTTVPVGAPILAVDVASDVPAPAAGRREDAAVPVPEPPPATPARTSVLVGYGPPVERGAHPRRRARAASWTARHDAGPTPDPSSHASSHASVHAPSRRAERPRTYPPVRHLAHELGVDLEQVTGTGEDGLITRDDVLAHARGAAALTAPTAPTAPAALRPSAGPVPSAPPVPTAPVAASSGPSRPSAAPSEVARTGQPLAAQREVRTPVTGVRKHTAAAMVASAFTAPHATEFLTVDVTPSVELLADLAEDRRFSGHRVTVLALVCKAMTVALRRHPSLNAHWDEAAGEIVRYGYVDLGVAAATPRGLLVPVVRDAERLDLVGLADAIRALAVAARAGETPPADLTGGTISVTNIGVFGIDAGTPILVPGQAAILATGAVRRTPWEHRGEIALRSVMTLSLSFDHRLVDGEQASRFLADVGEILARPAMLVTMV